jgi:NAD(P)-dependent dehydrogenase (short-subunit alcohol dehydrogenase family)
MDYGLDGRVVVITGSSSGIGLATAEAFVAEGAVVVAGDRHPPPRALDGPGTLLAVPVDLSEPAGPASLIDAALAAYGQVDVLVNNVGLAPHRRGFLAVTDADWAATLEINLLSAVRAARAAIPGMLRQGGGVILSIASDVARQPVPYFVDYAVSKAALLNLSKTLSIEFGPHGIRANTISPGPTHTPALDDFLHGLGQDLGLPPAAALNHFATVMRRLSLGRVNTPAEVAAVVLFLASDQARQVTGADYTINAGSTAFV